MLDTVPDIVRIVADKSDINIVVADVHYELDSLEPVLIVLILIVVS